jgi:hypothetical protein
MQTTNTKTSGKLTRLLAIGTRGTAFAQLDEAQLGAIKRNEVNAVFAKTRRNKAQLVARNQGKHQGALWADSCSWLALRESDGFWLGDVQTALKQKLVRKARIETGKGEKLTGYVRADYNGAESLSKAHKVLAVESDLGRIECVEVGKEKGKGKGARNALFVRDGIKIEIATK